MAHSYFCKYVPLEIAELIGQNSNYWDMSYISNLGSPITIYSILRITKASIA